MSTPSFLSQRLSLVQEQQLELTMLAQHAKRGTGQHAALRSNAFHSAKQSLRPIWPWWHSWRPRARSNAQ